MFYQFMKSDQQTLYIVMHDDEFALAVGGVGEDCIVERGLPAIVDKLEDYGLNGDERERVIDGVELAFDIGLRCPWCNELNFEGRSCREVSGQICDGQRQEQMRLNRL